MGTLLGRYPVLALPIARRLGHGKTLDASTDVVIDGYPRSSNTLMVSVFEAGQSGGATVAHHVHAPAHVIEAVRRGIPALVLVRDPEDAVVELALLKPALSVGQVLRGWIRFYEPLIPYRADVVIAVSDEVASDPTAVVERLNERFGTAFLPPAEGDVGEGIRRLDEYWEGRAGPGLPLIGRTSVTGADREDRRERLRSEYRSSRLSRLRSRAERAHWHFIGGG